MIYKYLCNYLVLILYICGIYVVYMWHTCGIYVVYMWCICGIYVVYVWYICGKYVVYISNLNSPCSFPFTKVLYPEQSPSWFYLVIPSGYA